MRTNVPEARRRYLPEDADPRRAEDLGFWYHALRDPLLIGMAFIIVGLIVMFIYGLRPQ